MLRIAFIYFIFLCPSSYASASRETGTVSQYLLDPAGHVNGVFLKDGTSVKVSSELGSRLAEFIKPGDTITVVPEQVGRVTKQGKEIRAYSVANNNTGKALVDKRAAESPSSSRSQSPVARTEMSVTGRIQHFLVDERGDIDGVILSHGSQVKIPPAVGNNLLSVVQKKSQGLLTATGLGTRTNLGTVVVGSALTFDGIIISQSGPADMPPIGPDYSHPLPPLPAE